MGVVAMNDNLSVGAKIAWQIAAGEAAMLKHQYIEKEHIFIGICSIEKVVRLGATVAKLSPQGWQSLVAEYHALEVVLHGFKVDSTLVRRQVRERLGQGNFALKENENVIHRSVKCEKIFSRADELVTSEEVSCFHLIAAIMEEPGNVIDYILDEVGIKAEELRRSVLANADKKDKNILKKFETDAEFIIEQYEDASQKLSLKEQEKLYKNIKTFIEKLEKAKTEKGFVNIIKEIIFEICKVQKKPELLKTCEESLEDIEEHIYDVNFKSYKNELITGLKEKIKDIKHE